MPRRSGYPWVDEVESRGWGRRAPQSPSSSSFGAPQGNNKIYRSDAVFRIEKSNTNDISKTPIHYKKSKEIRKRSLISRLQVKAPARKYNQNARLGTGCQGILGTCRAISRLQVDKKIPLTKHRRCGILYTTDMHEAYPHTPTIAYPQLWYHEDTFPHNAGGVSFFLPSSTFFGGILCPTSHPNPIRGSSG